MNKPKFRAWDESDKKMIEWEHLINYCDIGYLFGGYDGGFGKEGPKSYEYPIPMQYTGHESKNVEIYSGYIFKDPSRLEEYYFVVEWVLSGWQFVTYLKNGSKAKGISHGMNQGYLEEFDLDEMLLVGNIHENPELLNEVEK